MPDQASNPFFVSAAMGAGGEEEHDMIHRQQIARDAATIDACEAIMRNAILPRALLAADAMQLWGATTEVTGPFRTQTFTGVHHVRIKLQSNSGKRISFIQFIGSPKSQVIGIEATSGLYDRRWKVVSLTAEGIPGHIDRILNEYITWIR